MLDAPLTQFGLQLNTRKRLFNPPSGVIMPFSYHSERLDTKFLFCWKGRQISYFFCHISGTGSVTFKRTLSKSNEPSPSKICEFSRDQLITHFFDYISGTGSRSRDLFTLDLWPHYGFQTSSRLFKSVELSPIKKM